LERRFRADEQPNLQIHHNLTRRVLTNRSLGENAVVGRLLDGKFQSVPGGVDAGTHHSLLAAIRAKRLLRFALDGKMRVAEPHDYGIRNGAVRVLVYQLSGASSGPLPGWRSIGVSRMSAVELLETTFAGGRSGSGKHQRWDVLFARVGPS
jgi:hypothetical protein